VPTLFLKAGGRVIVVILVLDSSAMMAGLFSQNYNTKIVNAGQFQKSKICI